VFIKTFLVSNFDKDILDIKQDTLKLPINEVEDFLKGKSALLELKGYSLAKIKLTNQSVVNTILTCELTINLNTKRKFDNLVINGYDKFPKNIKKNWERMLKNKTFNQKLVAQIYDDFDQFPFVTQTKYPEILFTKDSTKLYTYIERTKPNKFDGFIGFANDADNKLVFNGYLDLDLINILNSGERFNLFWKNDGKQQTTFNLGTEIPYLFKSPLGLKANINIFKQDSIFQNTKTNLNLGYYLTYSKKIFLGIQNINSVDIQNNLTANLNTYKSTFYTTSFQYLKRNTANFLFPEKTKVDLQFGYGNRTNEIAKTAQFFTEINLKQRFNLNDKNFITATNQTFYLNSNDYLVNELYRFGGINSIRGFRENTLQANFFSGIFLEYQYAIAPNLYLKTITDYGYFQDKTSNLQDNLLGLGFGFGLLTNNGLLNFVYATGSSGNQAIKLSNSIVQISFTTNF
jgi:hypothetical protein